MRTIDDVLTFIRDNSKPGDWVTGVRGMDNRCIIRERKPTRSSNRCPLCWMATQLEVNQLDTVVDFLEVYESLEVSGVDATAIASAADYTVGHRDYNMALRERLLHACHLPSELV